MTEETKTTKRVMREGKIPTPKITQGTKPRKKRTKKNEDRVYALAEVQAMSKLRAQDVFDEVLAQRMIDLRRAGASVATCAYLVGVTPDTLKIFLQKGENFHPRYHEFVMKFRAAGQEWENYILGKIIAVMELDDRPELQLRASTWLLERYSPHTYGQLAQHKVMVEHQNAQEQSDIDLKKLSDTDLATLIEIRNKALSNGAEDVIDVEAEVVENE